MTVIYKGFVKMGYQIDSTLVFVVETCSSIKKKRKTYERH